MASLDLLDRFLPTEGDQKTVRRWRLTIGAITLLMFLGATSSPMWVPRILETKAEAQEVHQQIRDEVTAIKGELKSVNQSVQDLAGVLSEAERARAQRESEREAREKEASIRLLRQQIYETQRDACAATGQVKALLLQQVDGLRSEFMALTGTEYPPLSCAGF